MRPEWPGLAGRRREREMCVAGVDGRRREMHALLDRGERERDARVCGKVAER
jgi:hypothetical protein